MRLQRRRFGALLGVLGIAVLAAGLKALAVSIPHLREHRDWITAARAKLRGASFQKASRSVLQARANDCGAACLKMVLESRGIQCDLPALTRELNTGPRGTSMLDLRLTAVRRGIPARSWSIKGIDLNNVPLPAIAFISGGHFVVVRSLVTPEILEVDDPALGRLHWPLRAFRKLWSGEMLIFSPEWAPRTGRSGNE